MYVQCAHRHNIIMCILYIIFQRDVNFDISITKHMFHILSFAKFPFYIIHAYYEGKCGIKIQKRHTQYAIWTSHCGDICIYTYSIMYE